jgi:hypothetical protein
MSERSDERWLGRYVNWDAGDQVNFNLAAGDSCTGATQYYSGTDTVQNGIIVAADVVQTG